MKQRTVKSSLGAMIVTAASPRSQIDESAEVITPPPAGDIINDSPIPMMEVRPCYYGFEKLSRLDG